MIPISPTRRFSLDSGTDTEDQLKCREFAIFRELRQPRIAMASTSESKASIIPCLRYRDAPAAIEWLCETFGFRKQVVFPYPDGTIAHAQLVFGENSMIMIGSVTDSSEFARLSKQPDEIGGSETQSPYLLVPDADSIYHKARAAGAVIEIELKDAGYGGRGFACRDLEGHIWAFDPWLIG
jgi:uncharacterized glyoxalase superfamily protein PhnB